MDVAAVTVFRLRQKHCVVTQIERNIEKYIDIGRDRGRGGGKVSERGRERERAREGPLFHAAHSPLLCTILRPFHPSSLPPHSWLALLTLTPLIPVSSLMLVCRFSLSLTHTHTRAPDDTLRKDGMTDTFCRIWISLDLFAHHKGGEHRGIGGKTEALHPPPSPNPRGTLYYSKQPQFWIFSFVLQACTTEFSPRSPWVIQ